MAFVILIPVLPLIAGILIAALGKRTSFPSVAIGVFRHSRFISPFPFCALCCGDAGHHSGDAGILPG